MSATKEKIRVSVEFEIEYETPEDKAEAIARAVKEIPYRSTTTHGDGQYRIERTGNNELIQ